MKKNNIKINKMKKVISGLTILVGLLLLTGFVFVSTGLVSLDNQGYNYKAHSYKGDLCEYENDSVYCKRFPEIKVDVKWNEKYMTSEANEEGVYERHVGYDSYVGSGAWIAKRIYGEYYNQELDEICTMNDVWRYSSVPNGAILKSGYWYNELGEEVGKLLGEEEGMMLILSIDNDLCSNKSGLRYTPDSKK